VINALISRILFHDATIDRNNPYVACIETFSSKSELPVFRSILIRAHSLRFVRHRLFAGMDRSLGPI